MVVVSERVVISRVPLLLVVIGRYESGGRHDGGAELQKYAKNGKVAWSSVSAALPYAACFVRSEVV